MQCLDLKLPLATAAKPTLPAAHRSHNACRAISSRQNRYLATNRAARGTACHCSASDTVSVDGSASNTVEENFSSSHPDEDPTERRMRESQRVFERVNYVYNVEDWQREMTKAGEQLVVLEVESAKVCDTGLPEEAELNWKEDKEEALKPCQEIKHVFARTARDSPDVTFLALEADGEEAGPLLDELKVEVLPTVQFYKQGQLLWEHRGIIALQQDLGEGVLYYGDQAAEGVRPSTFVQEISSQATLDTFVQSQPGNVLTVVMVSLQSATPCVRVFPAVMALAKNMQGYAAFARFMGDASDEGQQVMKDLNVVEAPTFLFYRGGEPVGRFVGSSRGDLIGQILLMQNALGIAPPPMMSRPKRVLQKKPRKNAWR